MPTYEYRCRDCGEHLEVVQAFSDDPLTSCPACSGALKKVFQPIGIAFKGSGFYKTDSRAKAGAASSSSSTPSSSDSTSSTKGDSSSASTSDSKAGSSSTTPSPSADAKSA